MNHDWVRWLPSPLRRKLEGRQELQKIIGNTGWLFADRILRMGVGLVVGVWVARYLGPTDFGLLNYAVAYVAIFAACSNLGLDSIVIRDIVRDPACADETLGTAFALKVAGGASTLLLCVATIPLLRPGDRLTFAMVAITAAGTVFQALDTIDFWFQSQVRSRFTVYARNAAFVVTSIVKVVLILEKAPLVAFAWTGLAETALGTWGLVVAYRRTGHHVSAWCYRWSRAVHLLRESWPLFLSAVFVTLYIKIDQVMLGQMMGNRDVGVYSAAVRLVEVWYFIPMAITSSVFPAIVAAKKTGEHEYYRKLNMLYLLMMWLAVGVAVLMSVAGRWVVPLVFGQEYVGGGGVLAISCWAGVFIFSGLVSNHWYLLEGLSRYTLYRHVLGAAINILLNLFLIPQYGINGAAGATLVTQVFTSYLFDLMNRPTRVLFQIKSRHFFLFVPATVQWLNERKHLHRDV